MMAAPVRVKVCGITSRDDALAAVDAGADALGFNFWAPSPRSLGVDAAASIVAGLPPEVCTVAVFVDERRERVADIAACLGVRALQFHGDEVPEFCRGWTQKVIKAIRVRGPESLVAARRYAVDFILLDAYVVGQPGGTGRRIPRELLQEVDRSRLILAGGLTADNVAEAVRLVRPFAVDVASGVERAPGKKDWALMRRFVANVRAA